MSVFSKELFERFRVGLCVKFQLPFFQYLVFRVSMGTVAYRKEAAYLETGFLDTPFNLKPVFECMVLDDGDGARHAPSGG